LDWHSLLLTYYIVLSLSHLDFSENSGLFFSRPIFWIRSTACDACAHFQARSR